VVFFSRMIFHAPLSQSPKMLTTTRLTMDICLKENALSNEVATSDCSSEGLLDVSKHKRCKTLGLLSSRSFPLWFSSFGLPTSES
jgi:hypothetical protein